MLGINDTKNYTFLKFIVVVQILALLLKTYQRRVSGNVQISKPIYKERAYFFSLPMALHDYITSSPASEIPAGSSC